MEENKVKVVQGYVESKRRRLSWEGFGDSPSPLGSAAPPCVVHTRFQTLSYST